MHPGNALDGLERCKTWADVWLQVARAESVWEKRFNGLAGGPGAPAKGGPLIGFELDGKARGKALASGIRKTVRQPVADMRLPAYLHIPCLMEEAERMRARVAEEKSTLDSVPVPGVPTDAPMGLRNASAIPAAEAAGIACERKEKRRKKATGRRREGDPYECCVPGSGPVSVGGCKFNGIGGMLTSREKIRAAQEWARTELVSTDYQLPQPMDRAPRLGMLTGEQRFAVDGILASSRRRENWLITGDAGRGKTFTVLEAMSALYE